MSRGRRYVARFVAAVTAVVVLLGVLRAGSNYFYCPAMHRVTDGPCCSSNEDPDGDEADAAPAELRSRDCCEQHVIGSLPAAGPGVASPHVASSPLVAISAAPTARADLPGFETHASFERETRAGPRAQARHRAELMVALN